jgi:archaellum component FlaD/FlaE
LSCEPSVSSLEPTLGDTWFGVEDGGVSLRSNREEGSDLPAWISDLDAERPYLSALPSGVAGESLVLDWMSFLRGRAGVDGTREALAYYRAIGWISEAVEESLADYAAGIEVAESTDAGLGVEAHRRSLRFVARLSVTRD